MDKIKIGLIGFGTIGSGVVRILASSRKTIRQRLGAEVEVVKIADLDITTDRGVEVDSGLLTTDANEVLEHPEVDVVVELMGQMELLSVYVHSHRRVVAYCGSMDDGIKCIRIYYVVDFFI